MSREILVLKKDPIISKLPCPLKRKVEAAHYLAQAMRLSRKPNSGIVALNFYEEDGDVNVRLFEDPVIRTEEIGRMGHNERMRALWPAHSKLEDAVDQSLGRDVEIMALGGNEPEDIDEARNNYFGERISQWKP